MGKIVSRFWGMGQAMGFPLVNWWKKVGSSWWEDPEIWLFLTISRTSSSDRNHKFENSESVDMWNKGWLQYK